MVRVLASADAPSPRDLTCEAREALIDFLRDNHPAGLPQGRPAVFEKFVTGETHPLTALLRGQLIADGDLELLLLLQRLLPGRRQGRPVPATR